MIMQQSNAIDSIASSWFMKILITINKDFFMKILTTINKDFLMSINHDSWKYWLLLIKISSWVLIMTYENIDYLTINKKFSSLVIASINFNQLHYFIALSIISWILLRKSLLVVVSIFISHKFWKCWSIVSWILLKKLLLIVEFWIFDCLMSWIKNSNSDST